MDAKLTPSQTKILVAAIEEAVFNPHKNDREDTCYGGLDTLWHGNIASVRKLAELGLVEFVRINNKLLKGIYLTEKAFEYAKSAGLQIRSKEDLTYQAVMANIYKHQCGKCGGTGYIQQYQHIAAGVCFECNGKGHV